MAYFWPTLYLIVISFEMAYGKKIITGVDLKTRTGPVLYTNMLGWPPMLGFAYMGGEYGRLYNDTVVRSTNDMTLLPTAGVILLFFGCIVGTGIGYSGWWCREKVSAASYTLIGVMNKCLTVLVNLLIWDQHAKMEGIASLSLCLIGGALYRQAPMRKCQVKHGEGGDDHSDRKEQGRQELGMTPLIGGAKDKFQDEDQKLS